MYRFICGLALGLTLTAGAASAQVHLDRLTLPEGFSIEVYAADVPNARSMARSPGGTLFVSTRSRGDVYAVVDADRDVELAVGPEADELPAVGPVGRELVIDDHRLGRGGEP